MTEYYHTKQEGDPKATHMLHHYSAFAARRIPRRFGAGASAGFS